MLRETEHIHSLVRRYQSPDEYPFFPDALHIPLLQPLNYPKILHTNTININAEIKQKYIETVLPQACKKYSREDRGETQENYGSAATCDVACLQALSRRIHFGKFVAESKFQAETERFVKLIRGEDRAGIDKAITMPSRAGLKGGCTASALRRAIRSSVCIMADPCDPVRPATISLNKQFGN